MFRWKNRKPKNNAVLGQYENIYEDYYEEYYSYYYADDEPALEGELQFERVKREKRHDTAPVIREVVKEVFPEQAFVKEVERLTRELEFYKQTEETNHLLQTQKENLELQIETMKKQLDKMVNYSDKLDLENKELHGQVKSNEFVTRSQYEGLRAEHHDLQKELQKNDEIREKLIAQIHNLNQTNDQLKEEASSLSLFEERQKESTLLSEKETQLAALQAELLTFKENQSSTDEAAELVRKNEELASLRAELVSLQERHIEESVDLAETKAQLGRTLTEKDEEIVQLTSQFEAVQSRQEEQLDRLQEEYERFKQQAKGEVITLRQTHETELGLLKAEGESQLNTLNEKVSQLEADLTAEQLVSAEKATTIGTLVKIEQEFKALQAAESVTLTEQQTAQARLVAEKEALSHELEAVTSAHSQLTTELQATKEAQKATAETEAFLQAQLTTNEATISELKANFETQLMAATVTGTTEVAEVQARSEQLEAENSALREQLVENQAQVAQISAQADQIKATVLTRNQETLDYQARLTSLEKDYQEKLRHQEVEYRAELQRLSLTEVHQDEQQEAFELLEIEAKGLRQQLTEKEERLEVSLAERDKLYQQLSEHQAQVVLLSQQASQIKEAVLAKNAETVAYQSRLQELEQDYLGKLQAQETAHLEQVERLAAHYQDVSAPETSPVIPVAVYEDLQAELATAQGVLEDLQSEHTQLKQALAKQVAEAEQAVDAPDLVATLGVAQRRISELEANLVQLAQADLEVGVEPVLVAATETKQEIAEVMFEAKAIAKEIVEEAKRKQRLTELSSETLRAEVKLLRVMLLTKIQESEQLFAAYSERLNS